MAYTLKQLTMAWTAVQDGIAPNAAETASLDAFINLGLTDAQALSYVINSADDTTAVALLTYQFFTGKSPTKPGLDYLVNSVTNPNDLNDAYYAKFNLENRYINFAANLGINGEGASAFAAKYGAMSFSDYVASAYETIIGSTQAKAAGVDVAAAIAYLIGTKDAVLATARSAGMITDAMTSAQIDLGLKAAMAGLIMAAAIKADIGIYAAAANNFMLALAKGDIIYNTDLVSTYGRLSDPGSLGLGKAVDKAPAVLPGGPPPPEPPEPPTPPSARIITLTDNNGRSVGTDLNDTFNGTHLTFNVGDILDGRGGTDTLNILAATGKTFTVPNASVTSIENVNVSNDAGVSVNTTTWTGVTALNVTSNGTTTINTSATTDVTATVSNTGAANVTVLNGHDLTLDVTDATSGNIVVLGPKGDVSITRAVTGTGNAGNITITGGADIDVTLTGNATPAAGVTRTMGTIFIDASDAATKVKVTAPTPIDDNGVHGALDGPTVTVRDDHYGTTQAGTITTVEVDGFGGSGLGINGSALTTLKASHGTDIHIDNDDAVASPVTTLAVTLNDIHGDFKDEGVYQTLNITATSNGSDIDLQMAALTAVTVVGDAGLNLTSSETTLASIDASGLTLGGLYLTLNDAPSAITVKGSATADNTILVHTNSVLTYTGGSGVDVVMPGSPILSGAIDLGGGDDLLNLAVAGATAAPTATIDGGAGVDSVFMTADDAAALSTTTAFASKVIGFEDLSLVNMDNQTIDLGKLGIHQLTAVTGNANTVTLNGMSSGDTLVLRSTGTGYHLNGFSGGADSLNLRLKSIGNITFASDFQTTAVETLNIVMDTPNRTGRLNLNGTDLTSVVVTGVGVADIDNLGQASLASIDASGITSGGLTLTLFNAASAITITGSATANNSIVTSGGLASVITYTGGSAFDLVSLTAATIGGAIALGGSDDLLMLGSGIGTPTATIDGGTGTRDTVMITAADAATASGSGIFASKIVNFERLMLTNVSNQTIDVGALGFHYAIAQSGAGLTLNGMTSGDTLELSGAGAGYTVNLAANGANDVLNLRLSDSAGAGLTFTSNLTIADIETLNVTTVDGSATPTGVTETLRITTGGQKVVNISGNAGVDLALGSTALTSVDASGVTTGGLTWTTGAISGPVTIKGAANGTNQVTITQALGVVTYEGGAGDDILTANTSTNSSAIIHFGDGNNRIIGYASVITAGSGNDNVNLANGGTNIDLGDGNNTYYSPSQISTTIKAGSGNDSITTGGGTASIDVGSGDDYVSIAFLAGSSFTSITGMGADDRLDLSNVSNAGAMGAKLVGQTTLNGYLSIAGGAVAGTTNAMQWFELNGDIYIVADQNDSTSFDAGTDGLVRLVGVAGALNVSLASVSGGGIIFH